MHNGGYKYFFILFSNFHWIFLLKSLFNILIEGRKSGLVGSELDSRSKGRGFESCPLLDGNDIKVMPGSIPEKHPILVRTEKERNTGSQTGHTKKKDLKKKD